MTTPFTYLKYRIRFQHTSARWVLSQVCKCGDRTHDKDIAEAPGKLGNAMPPERNWIWKARELLKSPDLMKVRQLKDYAVNCGGRGEGAPDGGTFIGT